TFAAEGRVSWGNPGAFRSDHRFVKGGQQWFRHVLAPGHPPPPRRLAQDPGAEDDLVDAGSDHPRHRRDEAWVVLVVGMQHHDDVGSARQRFGVARLLIRPVAEVALVHEGLDLEPAREAHRSVVASVVYQQHAVDDVVRDLAIGTLEGLLGAIGRQDDDDAFPVEHREALSTSRSQVRTHHPCVLRPPAVTDRRYNTPGPDCEPMWTVPRHRPPGGVARGPIGLTPRAAPSYPNVCFATPQ